VHSIEMAITVVPATVFDDVHTMVGPKRPDANVCWCLSYRLTSSAENRALVGPARGERVRQLMSEGPPGVLAYDGDEVVGWAAVHPRAAPALPAIARSERRRSRRLGRVVPTRATRLPRSRCVTSSAFGCCRIRESQQRSRHRGPPARQRLGQDRSHDGLLGTRSQFERAGFTKVADTTSVLDGFPRVLMRLDLRP
jgi:hypothetical protein